MMICTSGSCWMTQNLQNQAVKNWILERRYSYIIRVQTSSIYIEWTTFSVLSESVKNWWRYEHLNFRSEWDQFLDLAKSRETHNNGTVHLVTVFYMWVGTREFFTFIPGSIFEMSYLHQFFTDWLVVENMSSCIFYLCADSNREFNFVFSSIWFCTPPYVSYIVIEHH